jgi:hypothetical protein
MRTATWFVLSLIALVAVTPVHAGKVCRPCPPANACCFPFPLPYPEALKRAEDATKAEAQVQELQAQLAIMTADLATMKAERDQAQAVAAEMRDKAAASDKPAAQQQTAANQARQLAEAAQKEKAAADESRAKTEAQVKASDQAATDAKAAMEKSQAEIAALKRSLATAEEKFAQAFEAAKPELPKSDEAIKKEEAPEVMEEPKTDQ